MESLGRSHRAIPAALATPEASAPRPCRAKRPDEAERTYGPAEPKRAHAEGDRQRWGTFTAWLYWVNVACWAPAVFVVFAGTLSAAFWGGMSRTSAEIIVIALI